jgi:hypothetical protein
VQEAAAVLQPLKSALKPGDAGPTGNVTVTTVDDDL